MKYRKLTDSAAEAWLYVKIPLAIMLIAGAIYGYIDTFLHWEAYLREGYGKVFLGPIITVMLFAAPGLFLILLVTVFPLITTLRVFERDSMPVVVVIGGIFGACLGYALGNRDIYLGMLGMVFNILSFRLAWSRTNRSNQPRSNEHLIGGIDKGLSLYSKLSCRQRLIHILWLTPVGCAALVLMADSSTKGMTLLGAILCFFIGVDQAIRCYRCMKAESNSVVTRDSSGRQ